MEWPLPLWLVLEEESEELRKGRGLPLEFARILSWEFDEDEIVAGQTDALGAGIADRVARLRNILPAVGHPQAVDFEGPPQTFRQGAQPNPARGLMLFLNELLPIPDLYRVFDDVADYSWVKEVVTNRRSGGDPRRVNRYLLEAAFRDELRLIERFKPEHILDAAHVTERLRERKLELLKVLPAEHELPAAQRSPARQILEANHQPTANQLAAALNQLLRYPDLHTAFQDLPESKWVSLWIGDRQRHSQQYDPAHGNRVLLETAIPLVKKIDDILLAQALKNIHSREPTVALCLSGGGIRSATFALGVVQGLAEALGSNLIRNVDYLSTVSGGGYLGGWLSAWINRNPEKLIGVMKELSESRDSKMEPESDPIHYLRDFSNYLAPKFGILSADTWTLAAIYIRNLLLNWLILFPLFAVILCLPLLGLVLLRFHVPTPSLSWSLGAIRDAVVSSPQAPTGDAGAGWLQWLFESDRWMAAVSGGLAAIAVAYAAVVLPVTCDERKIAAKDRQVQVGRYFLLPRLLSAALFALYWFWHTAGSPAASADWPVSIRGYPLTRCDKFLVFGGALGLLGWAPYLIVMLRCSFREALKRLGTPQQASRPAKVRLVVKEIVRRVILALRLKVLLATLASGITAGVVLYWISLLSAEHYDLGNGDKLYLCLSVPLFLFGLFAADAIFQGLGSRFMEDEDREWVARAGAWMQMMAAIWAALGLIALFGPPLLLRSNPRALVPAGAISGLASLLVGWSSKIPAREDVSSDLPPPTVRLLTKVMPVIGFAFLVLIAAALALGLEQLLSVFAEFMGFVYSGSSDLAESAQWPGPVICALIVVFGAVLLVASFSVDVNKFSMHAMYRNRLIRAYLGASRPRGERRPNLFTGFDPKDNLPISSLEGQKPFLVSCMTLNLVGGIAKRLAWQERKAETFTVSPLHSGNFWSGYRSSKLYGGDPEKGISLGTAVAISGAAASPNCGYASSSVLTILLAIFNARLGWWLGNPGPAGGKTFKRKTPLFALSPLLIELLGRTNDRQRYVYLSDGGHFENLGLYEMVLRRCRLIVVVDASADPDYAFVDLAGAVRKIRIDLGIPIVFDDSQGQLSGLRTIKKNQFTEVETGTLANLKTKTVTARLPETMYCALGRIKYGEIDKQDNGNPVADGLIFYVKPTLRGDEPADVCEYARKHDSFPHESTVNQFFRESQFEAYRMLGLHEVRSIMKNPYENISGLR